MRMDDTELLDSPHVSDHERELREADESYLNLIKKFRPKQVYSREELQNRFDISLLTTEDVIYADHPHILSHIRDIATPVIALLLIWPLYFFIPDLAPLVPIWIPLGAFIIAGIGATLAYMRWKYTLYLLTTDKVIVKKIYLLQQKPDKDPLDPDTDAENVRSNFVIRDYNAGKMAYSNMKQIKPHVPTLGWLLGKVNFGFANIDIYGDGTDGVDKDLDYVKYGSELSQLLNKRDTIQERLRNRSVEQDEGTAEADNNDTEESGNNN